MKLKPIPHFKTEDEERDFWANNSFADYFDMTKEVKLDLSALKPSTRPTTKTGKVKHANP